MIQKAEAACSSFHVKAKWALDKQEALLRALNSRLLIIILLSYNRMTPLQFDRTSVSS